MGGHFYISEAYWLARGGLSIKPYAAVPVLLPYLSCCASICRCSASVHADPRPAPIHSCALSRFWICFEPEYIMTAPLVDVHALCFCLLAYALQSYTSPPCPPLHYCNLLRISYLSQAFSTKLRISYYFCLSPFSFDSFRKYSSQT